MPSTAILHQAFFPPKKSPWVQLLWWTAGSLANVMLTMVAYKLIKDDNAGSLIGGIASWKWLHIICAIVTFAIFLPLMFFLPNTPVEAKWLSIEEKVHTIELIRRTRAGIVNSTWKWDQVKECFLDIKSWLFMYALPPLLLYLSAIVRMDVDKIASTCSSTNFPTTRPPKPPLSSSASASPLPRAPSSTSQNRSGA